MDEQLRKFQRLAYAAEDIAAWKLYCRGLERLCGIELPKIELSDNSPLDALLHQAGNEQSLQRELETLLRDELHSLKDLLIQKMKKHNVEFFSFRISQDLWDKIAKIANPDEIKLMQWDNARIEWALFERKSTWLGTHDVEHLMISGTNKAVIPEGYRRSHQQMRYLTDNVKCNILLLKEVLGVK